MSSTVTTTTSTGAPATTTTTTVTPTQPAASSPWAAIAARLGEASTWAGIGGILLVALDLLPAALPAFHAALGQHGWAKTAGLLAALLSFTVAVARREGCTTIADIAQAASVVVETERQRGSWVATSMPTLVGAEREDA